MVGAFGWHGETAMRLLRLIGWLLILAALFVLLRYDAWGWYQTRTWRMIPAGQVWFDIHHSSLNLAQAVIERYVARFLWFPVIATILQWPPCWCWAYPASCC